MKKIFIVLLVTLLSAQAFSQDYESGDLNKRFYIRFGLSTPNWQYYGFADKASLKNALGVKSRIGGNFEVGAIFMLNGINVGDGMRFGINVDFISLRSHIFILGDGENIYNGVAGSKIGPSFSVAISKSIAFDIYAKINPIWGAALYNNQQLIGDDFKIYYGYLQMGYSFGVNVKLAVIMLGFEYNIADIKVQNNTSEDYWDPAGLKTSNHKVPMNGFNITFGFAF